MPDFRLADAEFDRQTVILERLLETVDVCVRQDPHAPTVIDGHSLPIIPGGGQNTMAAAAIVLLAAHFEEYIRQQVEEYATAVVAEYAHLEDEFRENLIDTYWRAGSGRLGRIRPKGDPGWAGGAELLLRGLISYPVTGNITEFAANLVSEHENNMRWEIVTNLMARVGVQKLSERLFRSADLKRSLGNPLKSDFSRSLRIRLNEFYTTRNSIVHSIAQNAGIGTTIFDNWAQFFRFFTTAIAIASESSFQEFTAKINRRKGVSAAP